MHSLTQVYLENKTMVISWLIKSPPILSHSSHTVPKNIFFIPHLIVINTISTPQFGKLFVHFYHLCPFNKNIHFFVKSHMERYVVSLDKLIRQFILSGQLGQHSVSTL